MDEEQFKSHYVATFLASYMASRYDADCMYGSFANEPYIHQPVQDAIFLADSAWKQLRDHI